MKKSPLIFLLSAALAFGASFAQAQSSPFIPKYGKLLIIGQQQDSINAYLDNFDVPGGFMSYTSIQAMDGLQRPVDYGYGTMFAQDFANRYPNTVIQIGLYMVGALYNVTSGQYDQNIQTLAKWLEAVNHPVYLRIGYEFDNPENAYDSNAYKAAFRYIVDHLRSLGVSNVAYVWHSACSTDSKGNFMDWYPGDDYVDWFGISFYNPMQITMARTFLQLAKDHHKPMMIAESSPAGLYSTRGRLEWFKHYFDFINEADIKVVCYINSNWDSYRQLSHLQWGDGQIQDDPEIKGRWQRQISHGDFLLSSAYTYDELSGDFEDILSPSPTAYNAFNQE